MHLLAVLVLAAGLVAADHLVPAGTETIDGERLRVKPGDRIVVAAGSWESLTITGVVGAPGRPVTVINRGGRVILRTAKRGSALTVTGCRFLRLTGSGDPASPYGFEAACTRDGCHSINVLGRSSDIEIDHVEVSAAGFAGFNVKDEPRPDGSTNRDAFTMFDIRLHHNLVHHTGGEGFYIGHTFANGWDHDRNPATPELLPHRIVGLEIADNITRDTGCEGIQVGSTPSGLAMHGNTVERPGRTPFAQWQDNGIQIGNSSGMAWGNTVREVPSAGFTVITPGEVLLTGNIVHGCGGDGMYVDLRLSSELNLAKGGLLPGAGFLIANNTIIDAGRTGKAHAISLRAADATGTSQLRNNLAVAAHGRSWLVGAGTKAEQAGNLAYSSVDAAGFVAAAVGDWRLRDNAPGRNRGVAVADIGILGDAGDAGRSGEGAPDVGAWETRPGKVKMVTLQGLADAGTVLLRVDGRPVPLDGKRRWTLAWPWPQLPRQVLLSAQRADGSLVEKRVPTASLIKG